MKTKRLAEIYFSILAVGLAVRINYWPKAPDLQIPPEMTEIVRKDAPFPELAGRRVCFSCKKRRATFFFGTGRTKIAVCVECHPFFMDEAQGTHINQWNQN